MNIDETTLTAFVLGEISDPQLRRTIASAIEANDELQRKADEIRSLGTGLRAAFALENVGSLSIKGFPAQFPELEEPTVVLRWLPWVSGLAAVLCIIVGLVMVKWQFSESPESILVSDGVVTSEDWATENLDNLRQLLERDLLGPSATWSDSRLLANSVFQKKLNELVLHAGSFVQTPLNSTAGDGTHHRDFTSAWSQPFSDLPAFYDPLALPKLEIALNRGEIPAPHEVHIESLVNGFDFQYEAPPNMEEPFAVHLEQAESPWKEGHTLLKVGVKGYDVPLEIRAERNLVFLIDVSGSMDEPGKLPLVKAGLELLVDQMKPRDRLALVTYGGASAVLLPSTTIANRTETLAAIEKLQSGGNTYGQTSIQEAFRIAEEHFIEDGENNIIVCTDGDLSLGTTDPRQLERLISRYSQKGITLSAYGFSIASKRESRLEALVAKGGGRYSYVDTPLDVAREFSGRVSGRLPSIASDLRLKVEFNPRKVDSYRLIGYEDGSTEEAGSIRVPSAPPEIGSAYSLTALYELIPHELTMDPAYHGDQIASSVIGNPVDEAEELLTVHVQYQPEGRSQSELIEVLFSEDAVPFEEASEDLRFAAAVTGFGQILRNSPYKGDVDFGWVLNTAGNALGNDRHGYRTRFLEMVRQAEAITGGWNRVTGQ